MEQQNISGSPDHDEEQLKKSCEEKVKEYLNLKKLRAQKTQQIEALQKELVEIDEKIRRRRIIHLDDTFNDANNSSAPCTTSTSNSSDSTSSNNKARGKRSAPGDAIAEEPKQKKRKANKRKKTQARANPAEGGNEESSCDLSQETFQPAIRRSKRTRKSRASLAKSSTNAGEKEQQHPPSEKYNTPLKESSDSTSLGCMTRSRSVSLQGQLSENSEDNKSKPNYNEEGSLETEDETDSKKDSDSEYKPNPEDLEASSEEL